MKNKHQYFWMEWFLWIIKLDVEKLGWFFIFIFVIKKEYNFHIGRKIEWTKKRKKNIG
jgi:hypothetical protein